MISEVLTNHDLIGSGSVPAGVGLVCGHILNPTSNLVKGLFYAGVITLGHV